jgi:hypothetical protein
MPTQDADPLHVIEHAVAAAQLMPARQLSGVVHSTSQARPSGHLIGSAQTGVWPQSIVQVCVFGHDVQIAGHWNPEPEPEPLPLSTNAPSGIDASGPPGSTQKPSTQIRPASDPPQVLLGPHANSWLRCSIEQLASTTTAVRTNPCPCERFTVDLRW